MPIKNASFVAATATLLLTTNVVHAADYVLKFNSATPELQNDYSQTAIKVFETALEDMSEGKIDVQVYYNGQLASTDAALKQIQSGLIEAEFAADGQLAPFYKDIQILGVPYLFPSREVVWEVMDGPFGQALNDDIAAKSGIRPLAWMENGGFRDFSTGSKAVASAADMEGLKIRTMSNPVHMEIVKALGASPTPIPWGELYTSLQTGVVDGQENSVSTFRQARLYEVQKHIVRDQHVYSFLGLYMSEKFYQSLPDDLKGKVQDAAAVARLANRLISVRSESTNIEYLQSQGVTITDITPEQMKEFQDKTQEAAFKSLESEGVSKDPLDKLQQAIADAEAG